MRKKKKKKSAALFTGMENIHCMMEQSSACFRGSTMTDTQVQCTWKVDAHLFFYNLGQRIWGLFPTLFLKVNCASKVQLLKPITLHSSTVPSDLFHLRVHHYIIESRVLTQCTSCHEGAVEISRNRRCCTWSFVPHTCKHRSCIKQRNNRCHESMPRREKKCSML